MLPLGSAGEVGAPRIEDLVEGAVNGERGRRGLGGGSIYLAG